MRIFIADGMRHANLTGYGELSRQITLGLADRGHEVFLPGARRQWAAIDDNIRDRLETIPTMVNPGDDIDLVLQIGSPNATRPFPQPTLIYTQNALGDLRKEWISALRTADGVIVPGEFDRAVFARYVDRVYIAQQSSDSARFRPFPHWREEGSERFTFMFVGSYSFRKGPDLLLEAFLDEFGDDEPVELWLHCAGVGKGGEFNHLLDTIQARRPMAHVRLNGQNMSPPWMCRIYNRVDAVITMSRGEGWCMPLTEALLCEKPVIAPSSTAMGEYLDENIAYLVPTRELAAADITDDFGSGFRNTYGEPGITYYEPDVSVARTQMRLVYEHYDAAKSKAVLGRKRIVERISWADTARDIEAACLDLLGRAPATVTTEPAQAAPAAEPPKPAAPAAPAAAKPAKPPVLPAKMKAAAEAKAAEEAAKAKAEEAAKAAEAEAEAAEAKPKAPAAPKPKAAPRSTRAKPKAKAKAPDGEESRARPRKVKANPKTTPSGRAAAEAEAKAAAEAADPPKRKPGRRPKPTA